MYRDLESQVRLRANIKPMEHVRTGSLLERYMNDMGLGGRTLVSAQKQAQGHQGSRGPTDLLHHCTTVVITRAAPG